MSGDDWAPGDDALCIIEGEIVCLGGIAIHGGSASPPKGAVRKVFMVRLPMNTAGRCAPCGCLALHFADGSSGVAKRFHKIRPHTPDAEDRETIALLTGKPAKVEG